MTSPKDATGEVEAMTADAQKAAADQFEKIAASFEDLAAFNQQNVDALVRSSSVAVKAAEEMSAEFVKYSKQRLEDGAAIAKELGAVRTMPALLEMQAGFAKASFDDFMKCSTKFGELYVAAAKDVFEPIGARAEAAAEMAKSYRI